MNWPEAVAWLYRLERRGVKLGLERMQACLEDLGHPQDHFVSVLVAGTNGKGTTAASVASCLDRAGAQVGLYTSPHLLDFRERIRLNGRLAPEADLLELIDRDREIWERHELSFFEAATALAFSYFVKAGAQLVVLEVGLGGRLDATNTVEPRLAVITSLGMDHARILGETPALIAREKAGILRPGVPAILADGPPEALAAVEARAEELGAPLFRRHFCIRVDQVSANGAGSRFRVRRREGAPAGFELPATGLELQTELPGLHQVGNAAGAVLALAVLRDLTGSEDVRGGDATPSTESVQTMSTRGPIGSASTATLAGTPRRFPLISDRSIVEGIARLRWPGRMERPRPDLPLLADVAHNREGARILARHLSGIARGREVRPVVGMVAQKDHLGFFRELRRVAAEAWIAPLATERSAAREELEAAAAAAGVRSHSFTSIPEALTEALAGAADPAGPLALLCGSFHTLEEGYRALDVGPLESLWSR